jgi:N-carbamoylputrescine amidase
MELIVADVPPPSPARRRPASRPPWRVAAVQHRWHSDTDLHCAALAEGIGLAASAGAQLICLMELTLSPYFASVEGGAGAVDATPEDFDGGPTRRFVTDQARAHGVSIAASMWEADPAVAPLGWNTAIVVDADGTVLARTRKLHIPVTAGYREDRFFPPGDPATEGPADGEPYPVVALGPTRAGFPTCWDQWFPELARAYSIRGAEVLVYPTAIGSEPDHPDFDTQPLWQHVIVGNGIANGTFMVAVNRVGRESTTGPDGPAPTIEFYGSSFISDPYGRVLVQAPRHDPAVIVADLDLDARRDWLELFPFLSTRRPDTYGVLVEPRTGGTAP